MNVIKLNRNLRLVTAIMTGAMFTLMILISSILTDSPNAVRAQPNLPTNWTAAAPIPHPIEGYAYAQCVDDQDGFYVIGGMHTETEAADYVMHYDASSDSWTELEPLPVALIRPTASCYEGKIYTAGGARMTAPYATRYFYIYDIASDSWTKGPDLPNMLWMASIGAWDGKLFLAGGTMIVYPWTPINHVDIYDIATGSWTSQGGSPMPVPSTSPGKVQVGRHLYIVGGWSGDPNYNIDAAQRYDMSADSWENGPTLTVARDGLGLAATATHLYAMGGDVSGGGYTDITNLVETLDYSLWSSSNWSDLGDPLPDSYGCAAAGFCTEAVTGGEVWSVGGYTPETIATTNYYRHAEPCPDFHFGNLAPESLGDSGVPGEMVSYTLSINNNGTLADTYDVTSISSWETTHPVTVGPLDPGESAEFTVQVTIPVWVLPGEQDLATITATSQGDPSQSDLAVLTTTANVTPGVSCCAECTALSGFIGSSVTYSVIVTNEGNGTDTFDLLTGGNIWTTIPSVNQLNLAAGSSFSVDVHVTIPSGEVPGAIDSTTITVTSWADPQVSDAVTLTTTALPTNKVYLPLVGFQ